MVTGEKGEGRDKLGFGDWHLYTAIFKTDSQPGATV